MRLEDLKERDIVEVQTTFWSGPCEVAVIGNDYVSLITDRVYGKNRYMFFGNGGAWGLDCIKRVIRRKG